MALPICIELPEIPDPFAITLPGGISIQDIDLLSAIQPALTPLMPVFQIIDVVVAVFNCVKAIPDCLAPPSPGPLLQCFPDLAAKIAKLLKLIPQLSLPLTIVGIIDLLIDTLQKAKRMLVHLQQQITSILEAIDIGTNLNDAGLLQICVCSEANVNQEAANLGKMLASLGKLIAILNIFLGLVGAPEIPDLSSLAGTPLDIAIKPIDAIIKLLTSVRSAVPVP
jgi:hypothetical protein